MKSVLLLSLWCSTFHSFCLRCSWQYLMNPYLKRLKRFILAPFEGWVQYSWVWSSALHWLMPALGAIKHSCQIPSWVFLMLPLWLGVLLSWHSTSCWFRFPVYCTYFVRTVHIVLVRHFYWDACTWSSGCNWPPYCVQNCVAMPRTAGLSNLGKICPCSGFFFSSLISLSMQSPELFLILLL